MDEFLDELEYDLPAKLIETLRRDARRKDRRSRRKMTERGNAPVMAEYSAGDIWLVDDRKVHFDGGRRDDSYHLGARPGVVLIPPDETTRHEVLWIPGSSKLWGRAPSSTVFFRKSAFLLCFYEWYLPKTLERRKDKLPDEKLAEMRQKWDGRKCDE
jgi:hypothetical protein